MVVDVGRVECEMIARGALLKNDLQVERVEVREKQ